MNHKLTIAQTLKLLNIIQFAAPIIMVIIGFIISMPDVVFPEADPMRRYILWILSGAALLEFLTIRFFLIPQIKKNLPVNMKDDGFKS